MQNGQKVKKGGYLRENHPIMIQKNFDKHMIFFAANRERKKRNIETEFLLREIYILLSKSTDVNKNI